MSLCLKHISYTVDNQSILHDVSWDLPRGQHGVLLGASGCGKTTLLHLIANLLTPSIGEVHWNNEPVATLQRRGKWRGVQLGMVFQTLHLVGALSVRGNIELAQTLAGKPHDTVAITHVLSRLGIADKADSFPHTLSVGQAQRVAVARAIINSPALILADEPTSALDDANARATIELLLEQAAACGASLLVATHDARIVSYFDQRLAL